MTKKYLFADESGCFTFQRGPNISKYFIICTVTLLDLTVADELAELRRKFIWNKEEVGDYFHATTDKQPIRDQVFEVIARNKIGIQATICEKSKANPSITKSKALFYKYPWFYTFKFGLAPHLAKTDELLITAASVGTQKEKATFCNELEDVMKRTVCAKWAVDFRPSSCDPCLQVADYCGWAIQRKWEKGDTRSYDLIKSKITREFDLWSHGKTHYY